MESVENFNLQSKWILWYHAVDDNNWSMESYKKVFEIKTYYDLLFVGKMYIKNRRKNDHYQIK